MSQEGESKEEVSIFDKSQTYTSNGAPEVQMVEK